MGILLDFCAEILYNSKQNEHGVLNTGDRRRGGLTGELSELEN
jgi:hypothetical protein